MEAAGIVQRVRRLVRRVVDFGGLARLTTVQTSNLYAFNEPSPTAHLLPTRKPRPNKIVKLLASLGGSLSFEPSPPSGRITTLGVFRKEPNKSGRAILGSSAAQHASSARGLVIVQ